MGVSSLSPKGCSGLSVLLLFEFEFRLLRSAAGRALALSGNLSPCGVFWRMAMFSGRALVTLARALMRALECGGFAPLGHVSLRVSLFRASQYSAAAFFIVLLRPLVWAPVFAASSRAEHLDF